MAKKSPRYAMYTPRELLKRWRLEKMSVEQAVGQLILRIMDLIKRLARVKAWQLAFQQKLRDFNKRLLAVEAQLAEDFVEE